MNSKETLRWPKVSVITVVFNRVETIGKTIENTLSQTYPNLECVVIDGASTDGTMEIVKSYADRIRWISEPDNGIYDAMMKGARMATGEWVIFRNTGDYFYSNHVIKDIFENYEDKGEDFITGRVRYFVNHYYIDVDDFDNYPKKSYFESIPAHPSTFIRRATQLANPYNLKYKQDADRYFFMTLLRNGGTYYKTPCIVALFDKRTGATTDHYDVTLQERIEIYYLFKFRMLRRYRKIEVDSRFSAAEDRGQHFVCGTAAAKVMSFISFYLLLTPFIYRASGACES